MTTPPKADRLPPILPIVLFHGERAWQAPQSLGELIDLPSQLTPFRAWLPELRFLLHDLSELEDDDLHGQQLVQLTLLLFKYGRQRHLLDILEKFRDLLAPLMQSGDGFSILLTYLHLVEPDFNRPRLEKLMASFLDVDEHVPYRTIADTYRDEGHQDGLQKGRLEGQRQLVLSALQRRAAALPEHITDRIAQANEGELQRWLHALLDGASFDDLDLTH